MASQYSSQNGKDAWNLNEKNATSPEIAQKFAQLAQINAKLEELNKTEPLPPEFDEILSRRVKFARVLSL